MLDTFSATGHTLFGLGEGWCLDIAWLRQPSTQLSFFENQPGNGPVFRIGEMNFGDQSATSGSG